MGEAQDTEGVDVKEHVENQEDSEEDECEENQRLEDLENKRMEDSLLERSKGKDRAVHQRGRKKGQKAKARDANPVSKRSSRLKN